jgi:hypothetical protein
MLMVVFLGLIEKMRSDKRLGNTVFVIKIDAFIYHNNKHWIYVWLAVIMIVKKTKRWLEEKDIKQSEFAMPLE